MGLRDVHHLLQPPFRPRAELGPSRRTDFQHPFERRAGFLESYYRLSPKTQLDQQYTRAAYDHCQSLLSYFPDSEFAPRATEMSAELRNKLADKEFSAGEFYFKRNAFDSAIIYYEATLRDYADSGQAPRALSRLISIYQSLGYKEEEEAARQRLLKDYPNSPEARAIQSPATANP